MIIRQLTQWAHDQPQVRAMLLTSSRAIPHAPKDMFSDYDVILVLNDVQSFYDDRTWLEVFGPVLVVYRDPLIYERGFPRSAYVTQYENGLKIDFTLWPVGFFRELVAHTTLPDEFDAGYQVLLDKDQLTEGLKPPSYTAYIPQPPTETAFQVTLEEFYLDATYVAKMLWRDDLMAAKHILDHSMKQQYLRPMLEWHMELEHNWSVKPGLYGQRLKFWLRPDLWAELESTYTGADKEANWSALFRSIELMHRVAGEVAERMGYRYPEELERRVIVYLQRVRNLKQDHELFNNEPDRQGSV
jgi:aminoglycoside 6-adenylyltransferase